MKISSIQTYNQNNSSQRMHNNGKGSVQFTGLCDRLSVKLADGYYKRLYNSTFAKKFLENTKSKKWDNMTTHMSALGATLISGMYIMRTLQNDKLDPEKRKTLALNDLLTWGISTAGAYFMDAKLSKWWDGVTTRFSANYLLDNQEAKRADLFGEWDPKDLKEIMQNWHQKIKADSAEGQELIKTLGKKAYTNVRDFNLDVLKNRRLTTMIDGMGVLKSLFVFGLVYRYIVPVLVMKPANMIGKYYHDAKAKKATQEIQNVK